MKEKGEGILWRLRRREHNGYHVAFGLGKPWSKENSPMRNLMGGNYASKGTWRTKKTTIEIQKSKIEPLGILANVLEVWK